MHADVLHYIKVSLGSFLLVKGYLTSLTYDFFALYSCSTRDAKKVSPVNFDIIKLIVLFNYRRDFFHEGLNRNFLLSEECFFEMVSFPFLASES